MAMEYEDHVPIATPEGVELELLLAGLGSRATAALLDALLRVAVLIAVLIVLAVAGAGGAVASAVIAIVVFLLLFGYDVLFETRAGGRTLGKRWSGLRVVGPTGEAVTLRASVVRNLLRIVDWLPSAYLVGIVAILASAQNRRLGDMAGGTLVVRERRLVAGAVAAAVRAPVGWDASGISSEELGLVRDFLERRWTLEPAARGRLAQSLAASLRTRVPGSDPTLDAEAFLELLLAARVDR